jgi:hypothetical protein
MLLRSICSAPLIDSDPFFCTARLQALLMRLPSDGGTDQILRNIIAERVPDLPEYLRACC